MILDTNAVSAWWAGTPAVIEIMSRATAVHLPVPVLAEYQFGILKSSRRDKMQAWFEEAKRRSTLLPADAGTAENYARIRRRLENAGTPIPMNDLWIAAIASQHALPIISRDTHFDLVPGIIRMKW